MVSPAAHPSIATKSALAALLKRTKASRAAILRRMVGRPPKKSHPTLPPQAKAWAKFEELKAKYLPYVYLAAAAFVLILMLPGFIGALFAIWVVRSMDRRRARKQERQFNKALAVVKKHGDEIQSKLAA
jgi:Flp pilus assembly protein TadB